MPTSEASVAARSVATPARERLLYLDNLRTFLTGLVICHHSAVAMGGAGGWYYVVPPPPGSPAPTVLTLFTAINQSFFMSLFFAISELGASPTPSEVPEQSLIVGFAIGGIVAGAILGAVLVSQDVAGWIVGLAVGSSSVVLAALLWSSRQL